MFLHLTLELTILGQRKAGLYQLIMKFKNLSPIHYYHAAAILDLKRGCAGINNVLVRILKMACIITRKIKVRYIFTTIVPFVIIAERYAILEILMPVQPRFETKMAAE